MRSLFYGRIPVEIATSLLRFEKKGITQRLMHHLKYKGQQELGTLFGEWLGEEMALHDHSKAIDLVIPVPLHRRRLRKRGYNQVERFGKALASTLNIPYCDHILSKKNSTNSQVFKQRFKRFLSVSEGDVVFLVDRPELVSDKHILLVDDIVTTGATLENCALELLKARGSRISLATIAMA
jgi:ComF family protein